MFLFHIHNTFSVTDIFMMDHKEPELHCSYIHYCTSPSHNSIHEQIHKAHWQWKQTTFPKWSNFILPLLQHECRRRAMPELLEKSVVRLSCCCDRVRRAEGPVQSQDHPPVQFPPELCQSSEITQSSRVCAPRWVTERSQISHRCTQWSQSFLFISIVDPLRPALQPNAYQLIWCRVWI